LVATEAAERLYLFGMEYPRPERSGTVETLFGHEVADPYRWLEDPQDPRTRSWSQAEDALAAPWLDSIPGRTVLAQRLAELVPTFRSPPLVVGPYRYWTERDAGQDHAVLCVGDDRLGDRVLVDPNALSEDHTVTLDAWSVSKEGDLVAYQLSSGGDEEAELWVMNVDTGQVIEGPIDRVRYSPVAWLPDGEAFFYARRLPPDEVPVGEEAFHRRVWLHWVGDDPSDDQVVFVPSDKTAYFDVDVSEDGSWVAVSVSFGTAPRNDVYLAGVSDLRRFAGLRNQPPLNWTTVCEGVDAQVSCQVAVDGRMYLLTDYQAPRRRLMVADPRSPGMESWVELVGEDPAGGVLESFALAGEALVLLSTHHALSRVTIAKRSDGRQVGAVDLPGAGSASLTARRDEGSELWIGYTDFLTPFRVLHLEFEGLDHHFVDDVPPVAGRGAPVPAAAAVSSRQVTYTSADGTEVRMFVLAPGDDPAVPAGRPRPTILYGYGGFNIAMTPGYSSSILAWVQAGGVYAVACLRGGSEEGEAWHRDGMRQNKHHTFEDFEAAAEWLIAQGWTTPSQLAIYGGSNGGLLVGASLTRRPELFAAVVCSAPLLDMVRYERFGLGRTWNDEYGSAEDPTELGWLLSYSPYHHVRPGVGYPAVLFTVFEGDSRVDTLHARKMCAALQFATASDPSGRPVLLRNETGVGHSTRSVQRSVELNADLLGFLAVQLGLQIAR
jgi:prolyl oligopeptidase